MNTFMIIVDDVDLELTIDEQFKVMQKQDN